MVRFFCKTPRSSDEGKEDAAKTKPDATSEAVANSIAVPLVDRYCFLQGDQFHKLGDTVCVLNVLPALEATQQKITESKDQIAILREQLRTDNVQTRISAHDALQVMEHR